MLKFGAQILESYRKITEKEDQDGSVEELMGKLYCPICKAKPAIKSKPNRGNPGRIRYTSCCDDMCYVFCQDCKAQSQHFHRWRLRGAIKSWARGNRILPKKEAKCPGPSYLRK